jgi:membrane protease YdiL (CAAX protease family)
MRVCPECGAEQGEENRAQQVCSRCGSVLKELSTVGLGLERPGSPPDPSPAERTPRTGFRTLLLLASACVGGYLVAAVILVSMRPRLAPPEYMAALAVAELVILLLVPVAVLRRSALELFSIDRPNLRLLPHVLVLGVAAWILGLQLDGLMASLLNMPFTLSHLRGTPNDLDIAMLRVVMITSVMAAVAEEIFFRGFLLRTLLLKLSPWIAVATAALVFAVGHAPLIRIPTLFVGGLVFGCIAYYTRSVWYAVLFHAAYNLAGIAMRHCVPLGTQTSDVLDLPTLLFVGGAVLVGLVWLHAAGARSPDGTREPAVDRNIPEAPRRWLSRIAGVLSTACLAVAAAVGYGSLNHRGVIGRGMDSQVRFYGWKVVNEAETPREVSPPRRRGGRTDDPRGSAAPAWHAIVGLEGTPAEILTRVLEDEQPPVRAHALASVVAQLERIEQRSPRLPNPWPPSPPRAEALMDQLLRCLEDGDPSIRDSATLIVRRGMLNNEAKWQAFHAARGLQRLPEDVLVSMLQVPTWELSVSSIPMLAACMANDSERVRAAALASLGKVRYLRDARRFFRTEGAQAAINEILKASMAQQPLRSQASGIIRELCAGDAAAGEFFLQLLRTADEPQKRELLRLASRGKYPHGWARDAPEIALEWASCTLERVESERDTGPLQDQDRQYALEILDLCAGRVDDTALLSSLVTVGGVDYLLKLAEPDAATRLAAAKVLTHLLHVQNAESGALLQALTSDSVTVRKAAVQHLLDRNTSLRREVSKEPSACSEAILALIDCAGDPNPDLQQVAMRLLATWYPVFEQAQFAEALNASPAKAYIMTAKEVEEPLWLRHSAQQLARFCRPD